MVNRVILVGRLGKDPEARQTDKGHDMVVLRLATTRNDRDGNEQVEWHRLAVWGDTASHCQKYLRTGSMVYVEGRLEHKRWKSDKGIQVTSAEVVVEKVTFLWSR